MTSELESYFKKIHSRRNEAQILAYRTVFAPGWAPEPNRCHVNVDYWVRFNPQRKAVRGWLIRGSGGGDSRNYAAHSAVEENRELYDITLGSQAECDHYPFVRHLGTPEQYATILESVPSDQWYPPCSPDLSGADESGDQEPPMQIDTDFGRTFSQ